MVGSTSGVAEETKRGEGCGRRVPKPKQVQNKDNLQDQITLKSRGPIPLYYESFLWYMNPKPF